MRQVITVSILAIGCIIALVVLRVCSEKYTSLRRIGLRKGRALVGPDQSLIDDRFKSKKFRGHRYSRQKQRHHSFRSHKIHGV
jgi:hypothetical protein